MRSKRALFILSVFLPILGGCGGGGAASSASLDTTSNTRGVAVAPNNTTSAGNTVAGSAASGGASSAQYPVSSQLRTVLPNNAWNYRVLGTKTDVSGNVFSVSGSYTVSISQTVYAGKVVLAKTGHLVAQGSDGILQDTTDLEYFYQDSISGLITLADNKGPGGTMRTLIPGFVTTPSIWTLDTWYNHQVKYSTGETEEDDFYMVGNTPVNSPVATLQTFQATESIKESNGKQTSKTLYYVPQLSALARQTVTTSFPDGSSSNLDYLLTATNVSLP